MTITFRLEQGYALSYAQVDENFRSVQELTGLAQQFAIDAQEASDIAAQARDDAIDAKDEANQSAINAAASESNAADSAANALSEANRAKDEADRAKAISGFDGLHNTLAGRNDPNAHDASAIGFKDSNVEEALESLEKFNADLANPDMGAAMVAYGGGTVSDKLDEIVSGAVTEPIVDAKVLAHNHDPAAHPELSAFISGEADRAEAAADAAFVNADVYPDVASGLAAVADGEQFQVAETDYIVRYRKDSETIATEVARLPLLATPQRSTFMEKTKNLFDGKYYPWFVAGSIGTSALLYNTDPSRRTAVAPIVAGVTYTVRVHDTEQSNAFRIATHTELPSFNTAGIASLTTLFVFNDSLKQATFVADVTGFVFVTVSNDESEPRLQIEVGSVPTEYSGAYVLGDDFLPASVLNSSDVAREALELASKPVSLGRTDFSESTRNLFDGEYQELHVTGSFPSSASLYKNRPDSRTAIIPIEAGETYTAKVYGESNAFRLAVNSEMPVFPPGVEIQSLSSFLAYNDSLKEFTFTAGVTGYAFLTVSTSSQEPLLQFEKGDVATPYVPPHIISPAVIEDSINRNPKVAEATTLSQNTRARLDDRLLFPKAVNTEMTPTDPGPRFIEYFDDKMWGYNFLTGQIAYSEDEGRTWVVKTTKTFEGAVHRLLPTADGEVLAMTSNGLFKSSGWSADAITWSSSKVQKHENATLFQFAFDGDGEKFILAEYAASVPNWPDSRYVWISTDLGETFNVVWDSLAEHGEEVNALTHLHAVCYDRFADRFYFSEGHAPGGGLYCSVDDGATWVQGPGMRDGVLASTGITPMEGDTNGPTVIVATPTGLVMGSDNRNNGMFGLIRREDPLDEEVTWTYQIDAQPTGVAMFAIRGWLDEASGTAYIAFRSERNDVPPRIFAANASEAGLVYQYPNLPVVGAQDHYGAIAKIGDDRLVAYAQFGGRPYTFRADLQYPNTEIQTMVRLELKKLGLL